MAWNGLVKKLRNGFRKAVFIGTAFAVLGSASCKFPTPIPTPNRPPEITSAPIVQIHEGKQYMYDVDAIDPEGDILTYSLNQAPDWLSIDSATGVITGTAPLVDSDTNHDVIIKVADNVNSVTQQYELTVKDIPPGIPTVDLNEIPDSEKNFNEESQTTINLPVPQDPDEEDNPVPYISATSLDGKVNIDESRLNEYKLIVTGNLDKIDTYQIQFEFGSLAAGTNTATLEGTIYDCLDVRGYLEDNETDSPQIGTIRVYDSLKNFLSEIQTNANGYFSTQLNKRVSELEGIIVQAGIDNNQDGTLESYVRTRKFPAGDVRDLIIRAVPYDSPLPYDDGLIPEIITPEQAKDFIDEMHFSSEAVTGNPFPGLKRWNFGELSDTTAHPVFKEIAIINPNPNLPYDYFVNPENIKTILRNSLHPKAGEINITIYDNIPPAPFGLGRGIVVPDETPDNSGAVAGATWVNDRYADGYIENFWVELKPVNESNKRVIIHEVLGHGLNASGHTTLEGALMNPSSSAEDFSPLEIKGSYITGKYAGMQTLNSILGINFY